MEGDASKRLWDYIVSAQEDSKEQLWENLKKIILHSFCNSLTSLSLDKIPNISARFDEESEGKEKTSTAMWENSKNWNVCILALLSYGISLDVDCLHDTAQLWYDWMSH